MRSLPSTPFRKEGFRLAGTNVNCNRSLFIAPNKYSNRERRRNPQHIIRAEQQTPGPRRIIPLILSTPRRIDAYFERYPIRKVMWGLISGGAGFYAGNVVTLSFGALAVNDVFAAIITLIFYEVISKAFYSSKDPSLRLWFANFFKLGVVASLLADAVKLSG